MEKDILLSESKLDQCYEMELEDAVAQTRRKSKVCFVFICYGLWQHLYELWH